MSKIAYYNFLSFGTLTTTSEATGFPKANLQDYRDYTYWKASSNATQTIEIDLTSTGYETSPVGYIGFAGHSLKTIEADITLFYWNGSEWESILTTFNAPHDYAFFIQFTAQAATKFKVVLANCTAAPQIAIVALGQVCDLTYLPDAPFNLGGERVIATQELSNTGNLLGVTIDYAEVDLSSSWSPVSSTELTAIEAFWNNHARYSRPFFYAPDGDTDGNYVYWAHIPADALEISKPRSNSVYVDSISLTMRGHR
jgi:hypothetical protein